MRAGTSSRDRVDDAPPLRPFTVVADVGAHAARLPVSFLASVIWLNVPTPLIESATLLRSALMTSLSGSSDSPPGLYAANSTSSSLKSVGLSSTRAPFESFHSRMPVLSSVRSLTILPGVGGVGISGAFEVEST